MPEYLNGVDLSRFDALKDNIVSCRIETNRTYAVSLDWTGGMKTKATLADGRSFIIDEPEEIAGTDTAPNPEDLLLSAVGTCYALCWVTVLSRKGIKVNSLKIDVRGVIDLRGSYASGGTPPGFDSLSLDVKIDAGMGIDALKELLPEVKAISVIPDTILRAVPVSFNLA